jgi:hypothetical protein
LPENADLRAPETFITGATRAAHCAWIIAAIMLALLDGERAWMGAGIAAARDGQSP